MCFSAPASFTASFVLGVIGLISLYEVRTKSKRALLLALCPLIFSIQQGMEGIVWLTHTRPDLDWFQQISSYAFLIVALSLWPVWVPWSVYLLEKQNLRKKMIFALGILGCLSSILGAYCLAKVGGGMKVNCHHISYVVFTADHWDIVAGISLDWVYCFGYLFSILVPLFISRIQGLWVIGACVAVGLVVSKIFYAYALGSVWCFFAALSSLLIYFVIRRLPLKN